MMERENENLRPFFFENRSQRQRPKSLRSLRDLAKVLGAAGIGITSSVPILKTKESTGLKRNVSRLRRNFRVVGQPITLRRLFLHQVAPFLHQILYPTGRFTIGRQTAQLVT
jgi:hypothetical protein